MDKKSIGTIMIGVGFLLLIPSVNKENWFWGIFSVLLMISGLYPYFKNDSKKP
jgi:hypothetical protein